MRKDLSNDHTANHVFSIHEDGDITILRLHPHEGFLGSDLDQAERLWHVLKNVQAMNRPVLAILVHPEFMSSRSLEHFNRQARTRMSDGSDFTGYHSITDSSTIREEYAFRRFISLVRDMETFVICAFEGEVLLSFIGLALACDYRLVSHNTVFIGRCLDMDMPPCGASPWFLARFLGQGKAAQLLYSDSAITADQALEMGLVNAVCTSEDLETATLAQARRIATVPRGKLISSKRMFNSTHLELHQYFDREGSAFRRFLSMKH